MRLRRHHSGYGASDQTGIDLAPMLDFVMNLLIFFIITAVFVKEMGVTVNRAGGAAGGGGGENTAITVSITETGEVWIDGRIIDMRAVRANVERQHASNPKSAVLIAADQNAPTGLVVNVVDQIHLAGVYDISFGTN
jgi:biopolymer transport protein ExbD